ncbi:MAG: phage major tail protein, TP901-1 family [Bosea sp. (in: a-proteobacteria)]|uniref:phage major tail protein, TP901-1 family n=1 Tax=Bosea sp. (in: a-proteobacteria) TaxID=1871050 RepID=UPI002733167F|nr:phage major tail protein, TP901-1 family [Bosea sp. (in: a-proteobacteria)]MDP3257596.1 phage major tail protein, TP901-1 family [Bosea sp. (in: a-proteobacteria)]MDP3321423.1 phage major tail protein, TP901-1 family [Bosea sp. (in: a-proteobacteria)]
MSAQKGKDLLLKAADAGGAFVTVAGLRARQIAFNVETVDVTHSESAGRWRELLAGAGMRRAAISGAGIFKDEASDALVRQIFFDGVIRDWQVTVPDFGTVTGPFQLSSLEYRGDHAGEVTFDLSLESAGQLAFTAL